MKPGDIVRLKCGGPKMVIAELAIYRSTDRPTPWWLCHWQDADGHHAAANYYEVELEPVSEGVAAAVAMRPGNIDPITGGMYLHGQMGQAEANDVSWARTQQLQGQQPVQSLAEAHAIDAIARERDEWKAKAAELDRQVQELKQIVEVVEHEREDWHLKFIKAQNDSATAIKAWRLLENAECDCGCGLVRPEVRAFIRDNPPPKEG